MSTALAHPRVAVSVDELKAAWAAVQAGQFRPAPRRGHLGPRGATAVATTGWTPAVRERVLPVLGCAGSCGASTVALALATAAGTASRVVECASVTASGLAAASTAELGLHESGWTRGTRGEVLLERASDVLVRVEEVPPPSVPDRPVRLSVLDIGWEIGQVLTTGSWVGEHVVGADMVVLVATATVPGLRRLEGGLDLLAGTHVCAAVVGPTRKKWPRPVEHSAGRLTRSLHADGQLITVPQDRALAVSGLDSTPLPTPLLKAAADLLRLHPADHST